MFSEDRSGRLRLAYQVLSDQKLYAEEQLKAHLWFIDAGPFSHFASTIEDLQNELPGVLPQFAKEDFRLSKSADSPYDAKVLILYLDGALRRISYELGKGDSVPVTEVRVFPFVATPELRGFLERDYPEIQRAFVARCWKSAIILSGGAIEAILLDLVLQHPNEALSAAPREQDFFKWGLSDLIKVCVGLGVVTESVEKLSHSVREFRNLVHPGVEMRKPLSFGKEEARIALEILHMLHRDLSSPS